MCQTYQENKPTLMIDKYAGVEDKESIWYTSTTKAVRKHAWDYIKSNSKQVVDLCTYQIVLNACKKIIEKIERRLKVTEGDAKHERDN
jgi:hypothetical protein